ncbi:MAG: FAD-binding protein [Pseudomonadaceae bacterium]|nr:FAD-binding protein [Pseudomonadaceae bacterium]
MSWVCPDWLEGLPPLAVPYAVDAPLAGFTTIKVGGCAEVLAEVSGWEEMTALMAAKPVGVPLTIVGRGSNMVVADGGIGGLVVHVGKGCDVVLTEQDGAGFKEKLDSSFRWNDASSLSSLVYAEAGADSGKAARAARDAGLTGLEFFGGIPGSIGGVLRMNAGAYGHETFDDLQKVWVLDAQGVEREMVPAELKPRYRGTELPAGWVYKAGLWKLREGDKEAIRERMREINTARRTSQPLHMPSSGSWFKNVVLDATAWRDFSVLLGFRSACTDVYTCGAQPAQNEKIPDHAAHPGIRLLDDGGAVVSAWRMVDAAGCRGWREGGAQVSEQHCNFFVNAGLAEGKSATAADLDGLSKRVEAEIKAKLGVVMEREVRFTGVDIVA